jgi:queuosine precursor transporter
MSSGDSRIKVEIAPQHALERYKYYDLLVSSFVAILLVSNIVAPKFISVGWFRFSGAQLLFPITYIYGDIFTEVYGYASSRRAIWNGFFASALLTTIATIVVKLPPSQDWPYQREYEIVLGFLPRIIIASLIAFWCGEFVNSFVVAKMKILTKGKYLWTRTIGSAAAGQAVDSILVMTIAFAGVMSATDIFRAIVSGYTAKVLYEAAMTPVTYAVVGFLKRKEGVDVMDIGTNFSPFAI